MCTNPMLASRPARSVGTVALVERPGHRGALDEWTSPVEVRRSKGWKRPESITEEARGPRCQANRQQAGEQGPGVPHRDAAELPPRTTNPRWGYDRGGWHLDQQVPQGGNKHAAEAFRAYSQPGEGLHAHRAPRCHPDHRHPGRHRPAGVPRPADEGPGRATPSPTPATWSRRWSRATRDTQRLHRAAHDSADARRHRPAASAPRCTVARSTSACTGHATATRSTAASTSGDATFTITKTDGRLQAARCATAGGDGCDAATDGCVAKRASARLVVSDQQLK